MAAIFQLRRGSGSVSLVDGELYLNKTSQSLQLGIDNNRTITLAKMNEENIGSFLLTGDVRLSGSIYLGNESSDNISALGVFNTNLVPQNNTIDVGTTSSYWNNLYANSISGAIAATNGVVSGSTQITNGSGILSSSNLDFSEYTGSTNQFTSSANLRLSNLETKSASVDTSIFNINTFTSSANLRLSNLETKSASVDVSVSKLNSYTASLNAAIELTGSTVSFLGNIIVYGTQSVINSTNLEVADNMIYLNATSSTTNVDLGIVGNYNDGTYAHTGIYRDSADGVWRVFKGYTSEPSGNIDLSDPSFRYADFYANALSASTLSGIGNVTEYSTSVDSRLTNLQTKSGSVDNSVLLLNQFSASVTSSLESIYISTASLNLFSASTISSLEKIYVSTASLNEFSASIKNYTSSVDAILTQIGVVSGSLILSASATSIAVSNLNGFTASTSQSLWELYSSSTNHETRIDYLEGVAFGGIDLNAQFAALQVVTSSLQVATASLQSFTTSANVRLNNLESTSASVNISIENINVATASLQTTSASVNTSITNINNFTASISTASLVTSISNLNLFTQSADGKFTTLESYTASVNTTTASLNSYTQSTDVRLTNIESFTSSINTTIKNKLNTDNVISGSSQILGGSTIHSGSTGNYQFNSIGIGTAPSNVTGELRATGDIVAFYSSDERLKENITPIENAVDKINQMGGYNYDWKEGFETIHSHKGHDLGVIAQEVQSVFPEMVTERETGYLAVDYIKLVPVLIEAIKELSAKVTELENK